MKFFLMFLLICGFVFALLIRLRCAPMFGKEDDANYVRWGHLTPYQIKLLTQCLFMYFMVPFSIVAVPVAIYLAIRAIVGSKSNPRSKPGNDDVIDVDYKEL